MNLTRYTSYSLFSLILSWQTGLSQEFHGSDELPENPGKIVEVTLFRDQALVTREVQVDAETDAHVVSIGRLPPTVILESVYAEGKGEVEVGGVRVFQRLAGENAYDHDYSYSISFDRTTQLSSNLGAKQVEQDIFESLVPSSYGMGGMGGMGGMMGQ